MGNLDGAFADFITGKGVERVKLDLVFDSRVVEHEFVDALRKHNFEPATVEKIQIQPGERIPAFLVKDSTAYFGWIFWEKFSETRFRKLWGSALRNKKGDWAIQIPSNKETPIFANTALKIEMDLDHPV